MLRILQLYRTLQKRWSDGETALAAFTTLAREGKLDGKHHVDLMDRVNGRKVLIEDAFYIHETAPEGRRIVFGFFEG